MNSQQELLDAINTISQKQDRSCDTPATVLRVEDDTVWVHIDGGADETPVKKTINCSEGETVQVRISNGSAFLVGNASAPPTDDKTANAAHFIAEEADVKATEAIKTANAIVQTVQGKVDSGNSNISVLSSTMYQNEYGVNIYNDDLAVGDSYAHIDGDSFDIKTATTAGTIDDVNDVTIAKFGQTSVLTQIEESDDPYIGPSGSIFTFSPEKLKIEFFSDLLLRDSTSELSSNRLQINDDPSSQGYFMRIGGDEIRHSLVDYYWQAWPDPDSFLHYLNGYLYLQNDLRVGGKIQDGNGNTVTPTILTSSTISAATTTYTFSDTSITADSTIEVFDEIDGFEYTTCSASAGSCTITFPAQSTSHKIKLHVW